MGELSYYFYLLLYRQSFYSHFELQGYTFIQTLD